jgi:hypothetical protein
MKNESDRARVPRLNKNLELRKESLTMKANKIALALSAVFTMAGSAHAVTNQSFETGLASWTTSVNASGTVGTTTGLVGTSGVTVTPQPNTGTTMAQLFVANAQGSDYATVQQLSASAIGSATLFYRLVSKDYSGSSGGDVLSAFYSTSSSPTTWSALDLNGGSSGNTLESSFLNNPSSGQWSSSPGWLSLALPSTAKSLRFTLTGDGDNSQTYALIDVSPVPEPGEWAMMLAGFGLIGLMANRKRRRTI